MRRIDHGIVAIVLFLAFFADLRFVVAALVVVLAAWAVWRPIDRMLAGAGAALLAASSLAFLLGGEVAAWALALTVAVLAGVSAARPTSMERSAEGRRDAGSTSREP